MTAILFVFIFLLWWSVSSPANKISTLRTQKNTMTTEDGVNINAYCSVRCCSPPNTSCVHAKSLQLCPTLCDPMDYSLPGSSVHGILQTRILERVAMLFVRASSPPRDRTRVSCFLCWQMGSLPPGPPGKPKSSAHCIGQQYRVVDSKCLMHESYYYCFLVTKSCPTLLPSQGL